MKRKKLKSWSNNSYLKYSALGFEMIAAVLIGSLIGTYLDDYFQIEKRYLTLLFMLLGVGTSILILIKSVSLKDDLKK